MLFPMLNPNAGVDLDISATINCWRDAYDFVGGELQAEFLLVGVYASHFQCVQRCIWKWK